MHHLSQIQNYFIAKLNAIILGLSKVFGVTEASTRKFFEDNTNHQTPHKNEKALILFP
jgi:hypothetical protein